MEYESLLQTLCSSGVERLDPWIHVGESDRRQGWKIHVTTIPTQASDLLTRIVPLLASERLSFKVAADESVLRRLNEGAMGDTQVGKFMTIYPADDQTASRLVSLLNATLGDEFNGPRVVSDIQVGPILYARYGAFRPAVLRDRLGRLHPMVELPDGSLTRDEYSVPYVPPASVTIPFEYEVPTTTEIDQKLFGPELLLLEVLKSGVKGRVFLALDLSSPRSVRKVVVKEGRRWCLADEFQRDMRDRLKHQQQLSEALARTDLVPTCGSYFEVSGDGYLPVDFVDGNDIAVLASHGSDLREHAPSILRKLGRLARSLELLHSHGVVHRDLTPSNIRLKPNGRFALLDLELAYQLGNSQQPFRLGTPGYMSPQQEFGEAPAFSDDAFAFSCLAAFLLSRLDPRYLSDLPMSQRVDALLRISEVSEEVALVIAQGMESESEARPELRDFAAVVDPSGTGSDGLPPRSVVRAGTIENEVRTALPRIANGLLNEVIVGDHGFWMSMRAQDELHATSGPKDAELYRSAYRGVGGVVYLLANLARQGYVESEASGRVAQAIDWLLSHDATADDQMVGLHFGEAGVAVAIASAVDAGLIGGGDWLESYVLEALAGPIDWPDLTHGAAGQGLAAILCSKIMNDKRYLAAARRAADYVVSQQAEDGGWRMPEGVDGLSGERLTGFAHGAAGIIYFLSSFSAIDPENSVYANSAGRGAEWLVRRALPQHENHLVWPTREGGSDVWHWWCHGGPGIALAYLQLFWDTGNDEYAEIARRCLQGIPSSFVNPGLGQCHGLSGVASAFLEGARCLEDHDLMSKASVLAESLMAIRRQGSRGDYWLTEQGSAATADLMVGGGGVASFLLSYVDTQVPLPLLLARCGY